MKKTRKGKRMKKRKIIMITVIIKKEQLTAGSSLMTRINKTTKSKTSYY